MIRISADSDRKALSKIICEEVQSVKTCYLVSCGLTPVQCMASCLEVVCSTNNSAYQQVDRLLKSIQYQTCFLKCPYFSDTLSCSKHYSYSPYVSSFACLDGASWHNRRSKKKENMADSFSVPSLRNAQICHTLTQSGLLEC